MFPPKGSVRFHRPRVEQARFAAPVRFDGLARRMSPGESRRSRERIAGDAAAAPGALTRVWVTLIFNY